MIGLGISGSNLTIKALEGPDKAEEKKRIKLLKGLIPIYRGEDLAYYEVPKASLSKIFAIWTEDEIIVDNRAKDIVESFKFNTIPISQLKREKLLHAPLDGKLRDYQQDYITIDYRKDLLCFSSMGVGKTRMSLLRSKNIGFKKLLIVTFKQVFPDWSSEIRSTIDNSYSIYTGTKNTRQKVDLSTDILVTNYEQLSEINKLGLAFDSIIFDEGHSFGNTSTKAYKECVKLKKLNKGCRIQILTGSPLEHKLDPLFTLLQFINPQFAGNRQDFLNKFQEEVAWVTKKTRFGEMKIPVKFKTKRLDELRELLSRFMVRVNIQDYTTFEDCIELVTCELTPKQKRFYDEIRDEILFEVDNKQLPLENALTKMLRLLQAAEGMHNLSKKDKESGKIDYIKHTLSNTDDKVIIWSRFVETTEELHRLFPESSVVLNGSKPDNYKKLARWAFNGCKDNAEELEFFKLKEKYPDFKFNPGEAQFLFSTINIKSGVGMNLDKCNFQIFSSFDWSAKTILQCMARIKRMNSLFDIIYTKFLVAENTIEKQALSLILSKIKKISDILDGTGNLESIRTDEMIKLLRC